MTSKRDTEAALTPEDVKKILSICSPLGLLVGGQSLAFWADYLQVKRPASLVSGVTADADFIGEAVRFSIRSRRAHDERPCPPRSGDRGAGHRALAGHPPDRRDG